MSAESDLLFLRQFQRLLEEGEFVATYKFALLQALADLAVERLCELDRSLHVSLFAITDKFIEYYWRQALPVASHAGAVADVLKQNRGQQAIIVNLIVHERETHDGKLLAARQNSRSWEALRQSVRKVIVEQPLWKLQTIGRERIEFLYRKEEYRKADDSIRLIPGVATALRNFYGLVTNLIRGAWVDQVKRIPANRQVLGETASLHDFLFGSERAVLARYCEILRGHQARKCFYCQKPVSEAGEVDHFIAWSRYPVDLGHNFVFAHPKCNREKRDYLAHTSYLRQWREQNLDLGDALSQSFSDAKLPHDIYRSRQVAMWAYEQGECSGAHVWLRGNQIEALTPDWRIALLPATDAQLAAERQGPAEPV
jgi:hypothetical protein